MRGEGGSRAWETGQDWSRRLTEARRRRIAPVVVLTELARAPGAGAVLGASSRAQVDDLARTVTEDDDRRLLARLATEDVDAWRELGDAFDALTDDDRGSRWTGGGTRPDGVHTVPGPEYSEPLRRAIAALRAVGAVTTEYRWRGKPFPALGPDGCLSPADAVRAATAFILAERVDGGTIGKAARDGLLDAAATALRIWYHRHHSPTHRRTPSS
ncbi:DUF6508 domain-containing protein [Streptomyces sp. bgisy153]|uniref:DUF6508 domain-containing protein n=1 Tax=Streptomyces sp. bgisy153 TaxID=3413793 RepID=UPI003D744609